jgi:hypothetical protein
VDKLRRDLHRMNKRVKELEGNRRNLLDVVKGQDKMIAEMETHQDEVKRHKMINRLMWRHLQEALEGDSA